MWPFPKRVDTEPILAQAEDRLQRATSYRQQLVAFKDNKLKRQGELWSLPNLPSELQAEYQEVGKTIEKTAKMLVIIDEYLHKLADYRYTCRSTRSCDQLVELGDISTYLTDERVAAVTLSGTSNLQ